MKKILIILLAVIMTVSLTVVLSSCKKGGKSSGSASDVDSEITSATESEETPTHEHTLSENYYFDAEYHWRTCSGCDELVGKEAHTLGAWIDEVPVDGDTDGAIGHYECTVCGEWFGADRTYVPENERVIKANVTLTLKCYSGNELIYTEEKVVRGGERVTLTAPVVEFYNNTDYPSETFIALEDAEYTFGGYQATYVIKNGSVTESGAFVTAASENTLALKGRAPAGDATLQLTMTGNSTSSFGMVFNYNTEDDSYYWFHLRKSDATANLSKYENGSFTTLYSNYLSADYNTNNAITEKVVIKDGTAYCYAWNSLIAVYEVGTEGGCYGFRAEQSGSKFVPYPYEASATVETVDTLLFGHSYFAWWNNYYYSNLSANMATLEGIGTWADIGIGGSIASHWLKYKQSILAYRPSLGIYMIGINDITGSVSPATVADNVKELLLGIKAELPEFKAVLMGVNRCPARTNINDRIAETNNQFKVIAAMYDWVSFADIEYTFCDGSGTPIDSMFSDGLHPTQQSFTDGITPAIAAALRGENQPDYATVFASVKAGVLEKVAAFEIEKYYNNEHTLALSQAVSNAQTFEELDEAYEALFADIRAIDNVNAVALMDAIFSDDNSTQSSWDAVVANVKSWTHVPGTDSVTINSAREAGWQLTAEKYYNFEMTVKIDLPTSANPYVGYLTKAFFIGAESSGSYPRGYAVTIYKNGTDNWIQVHYANGNGTSVSGNFLGGIYIDLTDTEIKIVVNDGKLYICDIYGQPMSITNSTLTGYIDYITLNNYVGGKIGIFSWDVTPKFDATMSITGFKRLEKTASEERLIIDSYIASLNLGNWAQVDPLVQEAVTNATMDGLSLADLEEAYDNLVYAVNASYVNAGIDVVDAVFSDDRSEKSTWAAVVNNVKGWSHTQGTDNVVIDHTKAGWQLTAEKFYNFEMGMRMDVPTTHNPYMSTVTNAYLIGATSNGNYPKGYAIIFYKSGSDNWLQIKYLNGNTSWGEFVAGRYIDLTNREIKAVVSDGKLSFYDANGQLIQLVGTDLSTAMDYLTLDNYGSGGSVGFFTWTNDTATINDGNLHITGIRRFKDTVERVRIMAEEYLASVNYGLWANEDAAVTAAVAALSANGITYEQALAAYNDLVYAVNSSYANAGIDVVDAVFSDDRSEKSSWAAVVNNVKGWSHTQGTDNVVIDHTKAGWQLTAEKFYNFEMGMRMDVPTTHNPYKSTVTNAYLIGATSNGNYPKGYAIIFYKSGSDNWLQIKYLNGNTSWGEFVAGRYIDLTNREIKAVVSDGKLSFYDANGQLIQLVGTDLKTAMDYLPLDNYGSGGSIGFFTWTNDTATINDGNLHITGIRRFKDTAERVRIMVEEYLTSVNYGAWAKEDATVTAAVTAARANGLTYEQAIAAYNALVAAVKASYANAGIDVVDAVFSDDRSEKSTWDAVVNNVNGWSHTQGTNSVTIDKNKAGWQLTAEKFYNFEMTVKVDVATQKNPYNGLITMSYLIGATANGNYPIGYAVTVFKKGTDCWLQVNYMAGNGATGTFVAGRYGDFTDTELKLVVSDGKLSFYSADGLLISLVGPDLSTSIDHLTLDNYGEGGSVGFFTWTDSNVVDNSTLSVLGFKAYKNN